MKNYVPSSVGVIQDQSIRGDEVIGLHQHRPEKLPSKGASTLNKNDTGYAHAGHSSSIHSPLLGHTPSQSKDNVLYAVVCRQSFSL